MFKAGGGLLRLDTVVSSAFAVDIGESMKKDPRLIEVILRELRRIVHMDRGILVTENGHGKSAPTLTSISRIARARALALGRTKQGLRFERLEEAQRYLDWKPAVAHTHTRTHGTTRR